MPGADLTYYWVSSFLLATILTTLVLFLFLKYRHMIIKPTFVVAAGFLVPGWGLVFNPRIATGLLLAPWDMIFVLQVTPLILLLISTTSMNAATKEAWDRITTLPPTHYLALRNTVPLLFVIVGLCIAIYLLYIPLTKTGLFVIFTGEGGVVARDAREASLKLLPAIPRYVFAFNREAVTRLLVPILVMIAVAKWYASRKRLFIMTPLLILLLAISASLYGARAPGGLVFASAVLALFFFKKAKIRLSILLGLILVISFPALISLMRRGDAFSSTGLFNEFETINNRIFRVPVHTSALHIDYVQRNGYWGISGSPKLASFLGIQPMAVDNIIGNTYMKYSATSLVTVDSFTTNYTRFGLLFGSILSLLLVWSLDFVVLLYRRLSTPLLIPAAVMILFSVHGANSSNFETILITRGLLPGLLLIWMINGRVSCSHRSLCWDEASE